MPEDLYKEEDPYDHFEVLQLLGQGSYGVVQQVFSIDTSDIYAAKIMSLTDDQEYKNIIKEVQFLKMLSEMQHPNIVNYIDSYYSKTKGDLWIITEYCGGGSVKDLMTDANRVLDEGECAYVMKYLLTGLKFLKDQRVLHRDIKGGNILVTEEGFVKIADFGVSAQLNQTLGKQQTQIGTPYYMAPEVFQKSSYSFEADIWSTGITAVELVEGRPPLSNLHPMRAMILIPTQPPYSLKGNRSPLTNKMFSDECVDFVTQCLVKDQDQRPTVEDLLKHPFLNKATDLLNLIAHRYEGSVADSEGRNSLDIGDVVRKSMEIEREAAKNPAAQYNSVVRNQQEVTEPQAQIKMQNFDTAIKAEQKENIEENYNEAPIEQKDQYNTIIKQNEKEVVEQQPVMPKIQPIVPQQQKQENIKTYDKKDKKKGGCKGQ